MEKSTKIRNLLEQSKKPSKNGTAVSSGLNL